MYPGGGVHRRSGYYRRVLAGREGWRGGVVDGHEGIIISKGTQGVDGWVLMQMHDMFCFHYQYTDGVNSRMTMAYTPTYFADRNQPKTGPLDPSFVVVCAGRAGDTLGRALALLEEVDREGLFAAIGKARFGDVARAEDGGKGGSGVVERGPGYFNPFLEILEGEEP